MEPRPIPLREADGPAPRAADVIDAQFTVVKARKRGWFRRAFMFVLALVVAAAIGFLIPPAWLVLENFLALFG